MDVQDSVMVIHMYEIGIQMYFFSLRREESSSSTAGLPISYTVGPLWNAPIIRSDFKSEAIFGFPSPNYTYTCT